MLKQQPKQLSLWSILYEKIPKDHILREINNAVDFSFINKQLESSYSKHFGRLAKEPEMMAKLLVLQYLYNLSDVSNRRNLFKSSLYVVCGHKPGRGTSRPKHSIFYRYE